MFITQEDYLKNVLKRLAMSEIKLVRIRLAQHFKLLAYQSLSTDAEKKEMSRVPYASGVRSLTQSMVCSRPDLAYVASVVSRHMVKQKDTLECN